jgi:hypothetical protein
MAAWTSRLGLLTPPGRPLSWALAIAAAGTRRTVRRDIV